MTGPVSTKKDESHFIASTTPDVCWTPMGSAMVAVPYQSIAFLSWGVKVSQDTSDNSCRDFHFNSRTWRSKGHEPGTGKGVVIPGYLGPAAAIRSTSSISVNGYPIVRDGDDAMINRHDLGPEEQQSPAADDHVEKKL